MQQCNKCGVKKEASEYSKRSSKRCRECLYAESRKRYAEKYVFDRRAATKQRHAARIAAKKITLSERDAAYIAGIVDGEGWIGIHELGRGGGKAPRGKYRVCVDVANTNKDIVDFLHTRLGGVCCFCKGKGRAKDHWKWRVSTWKALAALDAIHEYLIAKKQQSKLCRRIQRYTFSPHNQLSDKALALQKKLHDQIRVLNKRGRD
jgi:hypothetical protein